MTSLRTAKDIFLDAAELAFDQRDSFVREACQGDAQLERRVQSLLRAHTSAEKMLPDDPGIAPLPTGVLPDEMAPDSLVGSYRLVSVLGEGGFGTVWLAEQEQPVRRQAAVKVLRSGPSNREVIARFEAERQALAMMDHPGIARVFDGGTTESGRPYFAMELVDGVPINEYARQNGMNLRDRLALFLDVCRAVQHAHQKGVIHRDIKPTNVLVTRVDGHPVPKVIDFGIAKAVEGTLTDSSVLTMQGQLVGTPAYMSPEQVLGSTDIDTRTDVYSLGVLLYELLCDTTPFSEEGSSIASFADLQKQIREADPEKPSLRVVRSRETAVLVNSKELRGDLDWIAMCCLEKDRERRYDSADVLANEIARHLRGEPVLAGPPDLGYRVSKFSKRHRTALAVVGLIIALLVGGIFTITSQLNRAVRAEAEARTELARYGAIADFLQDVLLSISPEEAQAQDRELLLGVLSKARRRVDKMDGAVPVVEATLRRTIGCVYFSLGDFEESQPLLEEALALRREHLGPDHPESLESLLDLGSMHLRASRAAEAAPLLEEYVERTSRVLGETHPDSLAGRLNFATMIRMQGDPERAEAEYRKLLELRLDEFGEQHVDTIRIMNNLAATLEELDKMEESAKLYKRALELQLVVQGETHPETLAALNNFASTLLHKQEFEAALPLLEQALSIKQQVFLEDHPSLVIAFNNLADCHKSLEQYEEAEQLYKEGLVQAIRGQGETSTPALILKHNLGDTYRRMERFAEGIEYEQAALDGFSEKFGDRHAYSMGARDQLGRLCTLDGQLDRAEVLYSELLKIAAEVYPADHTAIALYRLHHGQNLFELKRHEEALIAMLAAHEVLRSSDSSSLKQAAIEPIALLHETCDRPEEAAVWRAKREGE